MCFAFMYVRALVPAKQAALQCSAHWKQYSKEVAAIYQVPPPDQVLCLVGKVFAKQAWGQEFKSLEPMWKANTAARVCSATVRQTEWTPEVHQLASQEYNQWIIKDPASEVESEDNTESCTQRGEDTVRTRARIMVGKKNAKWWSISWKTEKATRLRN